MTHPFVPALCLPADFVNPYPALLVPALLCAGLLSAGAATLFLLKRRRVEQSGRLHALHGLVLKTASATAVWAWVLTGWLWWQSQGAINWCLASAGSPRVLTFWAAQKAVTGTVALMALLYISGLFLVALEKKSRGASRAI